MAAKKQGWSNVQLTGKEMFETLMLMTQTLHYKHVANIQWWARETIPFLSVMTNFQAIIHVVLLMRNQSGVDIPDPPFQLGLDGLPTSSLQLSKSSADKYGARYTYDLLVNLLTARQIHFEQIHRNLKRRRAANQEASSGQPRGVERPTKRCRAANLKRRREAYQEAPSGQPRGDKVDD